MMRIRKSGKEELPVFANMHNHSTFSDGIFTPEQVAKMAKENGYGAFVLTDHDTVQGTYFMQKAARKEGLLTMLGCEFTTVEFGHGIHLLGFDFNPDAPKVRGFLQAGAAKELRRTELLLKWAQEKGRCLEVTWQEVRETYPYNDYLCNNHIFNILVAKGARKEEEYFDFFVPDFKWNPVVQAKIDQVLQLPPHSTKDVIQAVREAGGVPVIAHPHKQLHLIPELVDAGLMGIECNHPLLTDEEVETAHKLADKYHLYKTGGTDHSGVLGGYDKTNPEHRCELPRNSASEADFMALYRRELG